MSDARSETTCRQVVEVVTEYLEGALPAADVNALEAHVSRCPGCRAFLAQLRLVIELASSGAA